jgi:ribosomal protein S1
VEKNRAWQEIANIVNAGNSIERYIKEMHKNGTIYVLPKTCIQVIQGFIHDDHEDLINKHVMMIRVTDNI